MAQINLNVTPEFDRELTEFMRQRQLRQKSEAIRLAVHEALGRARQSRASVAGLRGIAAGKPENRRPRFRSHTDVWEKG